MADTAAVRVTLAYRRGWVAGLRAGVVYGAGMSAATSLLLDQDPVTVPGLLLRALLYGVPFGLAMGVVFARQQQRLLAGTESLTAEDLRLAWHYSARGPAPGHPVVRQAALSIARHRYQETMRVHRTNLVLFAVLLMVSLGLSVTVSRWWLLPAVLWLVMIGAAWRQPRRHRRRISMLESSESRLPPLDAT